MTKRTAVLQLLIRTLLVSLLFVAGTVVLHRPIDQANAQTSCDPCPAEDGGETIWESSDPSSATLGTNLGPAPATGGPYDAHHIVPGRALRGGPARLKLTENQIDINDADNGLWHERTKHRCQHTNVYYDEVNLRVSQATDQASLRAILRGIAAEIRAGTFPR